MPEKSEAIKPGASRVKREKLTIRRMIELYCASAHGGHGDALCETCGPLHDYAIARIDKCPYVIKGNEKPTCLDCPIHCYAADKREEVRAVMRYSGPRMLLSHPWLAVMHLVDGMMRKNRPVP
jgi:hypothetical protein